MGAHLAVRKFRISGTWLGVGLGLVMVLAIVGIVTFKPNIEPKVTIGHNDEVYYYRRATEDDARALGQALQKIGFFNDRGSSVLLREGGGSTPIVSFIVANGAWDRMGAIADFTEIGRRIAGSVGGFPIQVYMVDAGRTIRRKMNVGKEAIDAHDFVYYFGAASEADARKLGQALQTAGYFSGAGATVALLKGEGTVVSFVVQDGLWDNVDAVFTLDRLVRQIAPAVGKLPIILRLLDRDMNVRKEVWVQ